MTKIWEVELTTDAEDQGGKLAKAADYEQAVQIVWKAALAERGLQKLDAHDKRTLRVIKVELYCETDVGE